MKFIAIMTLILSSNLWASTTIQSHIDSEQNSAQIQKAEKIDSLARDYFLRSYQNRKMSFVESLNREELRQPGCDPHHQPQNPNECIDTVCTHLGQFGCDQQSEISQVADACRGVDADCVDTACSYLGQFGCDQINEIQQVANSCRKIFDGSCMRVACTHLGQFGCDQINEIQQVGALCSGRVDSGCIESVCQRLGQFGCDQLNELQQVAKSCGGN
jgi:hypothetical protein